MKLKMNPDISTNRVLLRLHPTGNIIQASNKQTERQINISTFEGIGLGSFRKPAEQVFIGTYI